MRAGRVGLFRLEASRSGGAVFEKRNREVAREAALDQIEVTKLRALKILGEHHPLSGGNYE
jgi:hypothetical protein